MTPIEDRGGGDEDTGRIAEAAAKGAENSVLEADM
jgi:hypothetical protein